MRTWAIRLLPASTFFDLLWWVQRVEPGVLSAHARMHWPRNWPPASTPPAGLWLAPHQTAVLGATGGRPRLCPGQQLHWPGSAWQMDLMSLCPFAPTLPPSQVTQGAEEKENQSLNALKNCFCGSKAIKKHPVLSSFNMIMFGILFQSFKFTCCKLIDN